MSSNKSLHPTLDPARLALPLQAVCVKCGGAWSLDGAGPMISIDTVWARIKALEGATFRQIRGKKYVYSIVGSSVVPDGINQNLPKTQFEKALKLLPLENTAAVQHLRGPS